MLEYICVKGMLYLIDVKGSCTLFYKVRSIYGKHLYKLHISLVHHPLPAVVVPVVQLSYTLHPVQQNLCRE